MVSRSMVVPVSAVLREDEPAISIARQTQAMARLCDDAWKEFYEHYYDRLMAYALKLHSGDRASAEDSVQAGFLRVVRNIRCFDDEAVFWSWLTLLVRCAAADQGRKVTARSRFYESLAAADLPVPRRTSQNEEYVFVLLEEAMARLDDADRDLLEKKYVEGESSIALAAHLGSTAKAVECRLRRLRKKLKTTIYALDRQTRR
ncbi:MAG: sigma-70 family RNA polymerase sigma factor [Verrucomicrobiae bacterium]|nr:sigma-70 family RNA polymerase sigma factor [Verrucomicrobiae bacterium]